MPDLSQTADVFDGQVSSNPVNIPGLTPSTDYYVYIQSNCGDANGNSEWSNVMLFTTHCSPIVSWPYVMNFSEVNNGGFPDCWFRPVMHASYPKVVDSSYDMARGALHFKSNAKEYSYAVTPALSSTLSSLQLSFTVNTRWTPENGIFEVGVMSNPSDTSTFELVKRINLANTGLKTYEIPLISVELEGVNNYIAFRHLSNDNESGYYYLDDVEIGRAHV